MGKIAKILSVGAMLLILCNMAYGNVRWTDPTRTLSVEFTNSPVASQKGSPLDYPITYSAAYEIDGKVMTETVLLSPLPNYYIKKELDLKRTIEIQHSSYLSLLYSEKNVSKWDKFNGMDIYRYHVVFPYSENDMMEESGFWAITKKLLIKVSVINKQSEGIEAFKKRKSTFIESTRFFSK